MNTFAEILARAQACRTAAEIEAIMLDEFTFADWEWDILSAYQDQLLQAEVDAKVALCLTEEEAFALLQATDNKKDVRLKHAYNNRWVALANTVALAKARACQTAEEAYALHRAAPDDSWADTIYHARWMELELAGIAEASTNGITVDEAKARWEKTSSDGPAEKFYHDLWVNLANAEAPAKALACTTASEAWRLEEGAPDEATLAQLLYAARATELDS